LTNFGAGDALGKGEIGFHAQGAAEQDDEEDADETAGEEDETACQ